MKSVMDIDGLPVDINGPSEFDPDSLTRFRDSMIVKLMMLGLKQSQIAFVFNLERSSISKSVSRVPLAQRKRIREITRALA